MKCTYVRTIYHSPNDNSRIAVYKTDDPVPPQAKRGVAADGMTKIVVLGEDLPDNPTLLLELSGEWKQHPRYGWQFAASYYEIQIPPTREGVIGYLSSGLIYGVGPKTAAALYNRFGLRAIQVLEETPDRYLEIDGITPEKLAAIRKSHLQSKTLQNLVAFLSPFGISLSKTKRIYEHFGERAIDVLKRDPFSLCAITGFGFKTVDEIARQTGCPLDNPLRIRGAMQYCMCQEENEKGHVYLERQAIIREAGNLLNESLSIEAVSAAQIQDELNRMVADGDFILERDRVYQPNMYHNEVEAAERIAAFLRELPVPPRMEQVIRQAQQELGITLAPEQLEMVRAALHYGLFVATGGPGTGKTTTLSVILYCNKELYGGKVALMAPTGRAARRLMESTGYPASTIHSACHLTGERYIPEEELQEMDADFIIVDEFSMADQWLSCQLFRCIRPSARVMLLGDADQLPSVGPGNVLRELLSCGSIPTVHLDTVYRQSRDSCIAYNAKLIREGKVKLLSGPDFQFIQKANSAEAANLMEELYLSESSVRGPDAVQILTPFNERGDCSADALNQRIRERVNPAAPDKEQVHTSRGVFRVGDRVIQNKNKEEISNGDIGVIRGVQRDKEGEAVLDILFSGGREVHYPAGQLDSVDLRLAYAITIHKSQGNEYPTVIIPVLGMFYKSLRRNLIYTAITRAKQKVILVGKREMLSMAILRNDMDKRQTMLGERIRRAADALPVRQCKIS